MDTESKYTYFGPSVKTVGQKTPVMMPCVDKVGHMTPVMRLNEDSIGHNSPVIMPFLDTEDR